MSNTSKTILELRIDRVLLDPRTQSRVVLCEGVVGDYAAAEAAGAALPPVTVFRDAAGRFWLADGRHRREARLRQRKRTILCEVRQGELREAVLFAVGANSRHGLPANGDDKRRAVGILLDDPEWSLWSNKEIARRCGVSDMFVAGCRKERGGASANGLPIREKVKAERNGTEYEMRMPPPRSRAAENAPVSQTPAEKAAVFLRAALELLRSPCPAAAKHVAKALEALGDTGARP